MPGRHSLRFDSADETLARAAWSRLAEPGDVKVASLLAEVGPTEALRALVTRDVDWMQRYLTRLPELDPPRDLRALASLGGRVLVPGDAEWPTGLNQLAAPPPCLWVRGPVELADLARRSVSVVGARASTAYGEHVAGELSSGLAGRGFAVVSGLAYGIDGTAHRAALGSGTSVAVVAGGVDRAYPRGHDALMAELVRSGAVVSEVPPGSAPTRSRFLQRNRLIAAMTSGTVVVEAAVRSGALSTARAAATLGRPVGAVPGPVTSSSSAGCHALVREGRAVLVTDAAEVADLVGRIGADAVDPPRGGAGPFDGLDDVTLRVVDALPVRTGRPLDRLCVASGLEPATVQVALGRLALLGLAERHAHGWRRVPAGRRPPA
ncbi:DNA-processing protein DprA [Angustibacter sp. McL0619]|uniref:DNA-processing protein DprA n=1 Tax=Angustibacter sp. McL0619 TaxID=3415676 RepID=UPI003CE67ABD